MSDASGVPPAGREEKRIRFNDLPPERLRRILAELGFGPARIPIVLRSYYERRCLRFEDMGLLKLAERNRLAAAFVLDAPEPELRLESLTGDAVKFAFRVEPDSPPIESVLLFDRHRRSVCLSSQLGCSLGCSFCATGAIGFVRDLTPGEIVGQLLAVNRWLAERERPKANQVVFMGMGEALSNYEAFRDAVATLVDGDCFRLSPERITVSTAGYVPGIERLMSDPDLVWGNERIGLAVSLNATEDATRSRLMPIGRRYPIAAVVDAARAYAALSERRVTFEYVLMKGVNDSAEDASRLGRLLGGMRILLNLIEFNPWKAEEAPMAKPDTAAFAKLAMSEGLLTSIRRSRGRDISGACGQLGMRATGETGAR